MSKLPRSGALLLLVVGTISVDSVPAQVATPAPSEFWRRRLADRVVVQPPPVEVTPEDEVSPPVPEVAGAGSTTVDSVGDSVGDRAIEGPAGEPGGDAGASAAGARPQVRQRIDELRGKILGAEKRLLFDTAAEERALEYNAERRGSMRKARGELERLAVERYDLLQEYSAEFRSLPTRALRAAWLDEHRALAANQISRFLEARRSVEEVDGGLSALEVTDERLRRLMEVRRAQASEYGLLGTSSTRTEGFDVPLDVPRVAPVERPLSPAELNLLNELFPSR